MNDVQKNRLLTRLQSGAPPSDKDIEMGLYAVEDMYAKALDKAIDKLEELDAEMATLLEEYNELVRYQGHRVFHSMILYRFADQRDNELYDEVDALVDVNDVIREVHEQHMRNTGGKY